MTAFALFESAPRPSAGTHPPDGVPGSARAWIGWLLFAAGGHLALLAGLSVVGVVTPLELAAAPTFVEFEVTPIAAEAQPTAALPEVAMPLEAVTPAPSIRAAVPRTTAPPTEAPVSEPALGVSDHSVAGEGAEGMAAGSPTGTPSGEGQQLARSQAPAQPAAAAQPAVDHRQLARQWMGQVNRTVLARALREYPRAALAARLEGTVRLAISVSAAGVITQVSVQQSSGSARLDQAAVASVNAVSSLPAPPDIFNQRGRPLSMPITYRLP